VPKYHQPASATPMIATPAIHGQRRRWEVAFMTFNDKSIHRPETPFRYAGLKQNIRGQTTYSRTDLRRLEISIE